MTYDEVVGAVDGLRAYDVGCGSGIHDEVLRECLQSYMKSLGKSERDALLTDVMNELIFSNKALEDGCTWKDAKELADWFLVQFGIG